MRKARITASTALFAQALIVLAIILPLLLIDSYTNWKVTTAFRTHTLESATESLAARQITLTTTTRTLLTTLALNPFVQTGSPAELTDFFVTLNKNQPDYAGFALFKPDGGTIAFVLGGKPNNPIAPEIIREREYFQRTLEYKDFVVSPQLIVENPVHAAVLPMTMPVFNKQGEVTSVVMSPIDISRNEAFAAETLRYSEIAMYLFDANGKLIYHFPSEKGLALQEVPLPTVVQHLLQAPIVNPLTPFANSHISIARTKVQENSDTLFDNTMGVRVSLFQDNSETPFITLITTAPTYSFFTFMIEQYATQLLGIILLVVFAFFVARFAGKYFFSNGLERMADVAYALQQGNYSIRNGSVHGCFEIEELSTTYDKVIATLEENTKELQKVSRTDPLTGLWNRRYFFEVAEHEIQRALRYKRSVAIAMADIDHFKNVNDSYGHPAGDEVLRIFSRTLEKNIRASDTLARFGGEEFIFLFPEINESEALLILEKMRHKVEQQSIKYEGNTISFTASFGVYVFRPETVTNWPHDEQEARAAIEALIEKADSALYKAKESGRNRVVVHGI